jgi:hypothetical protein
VQYTRQHVVDMLRRAGFRDAADKAMLELPDSIDVELLAEWAMKHGITRDAIISQIGGSP